ncbi:MAG TPA: DUF883 family protein [Methylophilaceae bacterium]|nr:DUF883 family protein [Methylophilaceae bacterium]
MESYESRELPMSTHAARSPDELLDEFHSLLQQGQELLDATANLSGEAMTTIRDRFQFKWEEARARLQDAQSYALERSQQARELTTTYVHDHPWWAISVATGVGVLIGYSLNRRSAHEKAHAYNTTRH